MAAESPPSSTESKALTLARWAGAAIIAPLFGFVVGVAGFVGGMTLFGGDVVDWPMGTILGLVVLPAVAVSLASGWAMRRRPILSAALAGGVVVVVGLGFVALHVQGAWAYQRELAAWRDAGHATTWQELRPVSIPDEQNAAVDYRRAVEPIWASQEPWPAFDLAALDEAAWRDLLRQFEASVDAVKAGAIKPACDVHGLNADPDQHHADWGVFGLVRVSQLMCFAAMEHAAAGRWAEAEQTLLAAARMAQHLTQSPTVYEHTMAQRITATIVVTIEHVWREHDDAPEAVLAELEQVTDLDRYVDAMRNAVMLVFAENVDQFDLTLVSNLEYLEDGVLAALPGSYQRSAAAELAAARRITAHLHQPIDQWDDDQLSLERQMPAWAPLVHGWWWVDGGFLRAYHRRLAVARTAFRLRDHRRRHGQYPAQLSDLAGPAPRDPAGAWQYTYSVEARGFVLRLEPASIWSPEAIEWRWE